MKVTDLMIGDWVYDKDNNVVRVGLLTENDTVTIFNDTILSTTNCSQVAPIPLTKEILENNGFEFQLTPIKLYYNEEYNFELDVDVNDDFFVQIQEGFYPITYVHQLQHLLRFIDNELADKFKV